MATMYRAIENDGGSIQLYDLYNNDYSTYSKPCLEFRIEDRVIVWDNNLYLLEFFRGIKRSKKKHRKELKVFCEDNNLNYQSTLEDLLDIYHNSKKLKFWKDGK